MADTGGNVPSVLAAVTTVKRQRRSNQEKRSIVEATLAPGASVARVARANGVNANQEFAWRKLYRAGGLEVEASKTAPVPVRISDSAGSALPVAVSPAMPVRRSPCSGRGAKAGAIHIELDPARVRIVGHADPKSLRVILECLLG